MCGIVGYVGDFSPEALERANALQAHRGPDDAGFHRCDNVGLGHLRLSIVDLSPTGHQPMASDDRAVTLVFNGEIYNFPELRADLERRGHTFRGHSDTEVLLHLYLEEGEAMLPRLNGIFAFAIRDERTGTLFVARDALGVKPLYFTESARGFAFASEIKALLELAPECRELDVVALHRYLSFLWCPGEGTPLRDVRKLLPGEALLVRGDGRVARRWTWYDLPVVRGVPQHLSERESVEGTVTHLREAVHRQMIADVPVGAFLSGGLDSSAVVAFAREVQPDLQCFTIRNHGGQDAGFVDDLPYARRVAQHLGVPLSIVDVSAADISDDLQAMVTQLDEPLVDTAPLNILYISRLARQQGIKVLMSGAGGDDVFSGYRRHLAAKYDDYLQLLPGPVLGWAERASQRLDQRRPLNRRVAKLFAGASLRGDERIANYFLWAREEQLRALYTPEARRTLAGHATTQPLLDFLATIPEGTPTLSRMLALEQRFFLGDFNLVFTDKMSMAASVEVRVPFLDTELVEFAARIPDRYKQRGREGKWVLKRAMEQFLPRDVIYRRKTGFGGPLRRWIREELRDLLHDTLSPERLRARGVFDPDAVQRLIADNEAGRVDATYVLVSLLNIELWCAQYVDRRYATTAG